MNDSAIVQLIGKIEDEFPVNEWKMCGRYIWPLVKMRIVDIGYRDEFSNDTRKEKKAGSLTKISRFISALLKISKIKSDRECKVLILHNNISRTLKVDNGKRFDTVLDPFTLLLEPYCGILSFERMALSKYTNTFRETNIIEDIYKKAKVYSLFRKKEDKEEKTQRYQEFVSSMPAAFQKDLQAEKIYSLIVYMNKVSAYLKNEIIKKKVKLAIAQCGYSINTAMLFLACKDAGIKCMEVQHGLAGGSGHSWYASWKKMPVSGEKYEMLPDIFWCWTRKDAETIEAWSQGRHIAYLGRKPIYSVINEVERMTTSRSFSVAKKHPSILFSLQPGVKYPEWIVSVIRRTSEKYNWLLRSHPCFDDAQAIIIQKVSDIPNVYVDSTDSILLEKILMQTRLHITHHSAVVLDALDYNIKSIILGKEHTELFSREIQSGDVYLGSNESVTIKLIEELCMNNNPENRRFNEIRDENICFLKKIIA